MNLHSAPQIVVPPACIPNVQDLVLDDGAPVDGVITEKQMRLLCEPLYSSWSGPGDGEPFTVLANVGLFHTWGQPPLIPDVMLSLDVRWPEDLSKKENQSYFVWVVGKLPDVVIEIVSNCEGGEDDSKLRDYARLRIPYYVIYDPDDLVGGGVLRVYELNGRRYRPLETLQLEGTGLGLLLWTGKFEQYTRTWLRWTDAEGRVIPTGAESRDLEHRRAEEATREVERLRAKLRGLGMEPRE